MTDSELRSYLRDIGRHPILSKQSQLLHCKHIRTWIDWPDGRDAAPNRVKRMGKRSMDIMVTTNLRLVVSIAKKFQNRGLDLLDLIQEGNLGLIRGLELFDPTRGYSVSTYVYWWIRQGITRSILMTSRTIRLPVQISETHSKASRFISEHTARTGAAPTPEQVAAHIKMSVQKMEKLFNAVAIAQCASLDSMQPDTGSPYSEIIPCKRQSPENYTEQLETKETINNLLNALDEDIREIVERTVLDSHQIKEVSADMEVSTHRVKKLQIEGLKHIAPRLVA